MAPLCPLSLSTSLSPSLPPCAPCPPPSLSLLSFLLPVISQSCRLWELVASRHVFFSRFFLEKIRAE